MMEKKVKKCKYCNRIMLMNLFVGLLSMVLGVTYGLKESYNHYLWIGFMSIGTMGIYLALQQYFYNQFKHGRN